MGHSMTLPFPECKHRQRIAQWALWRQPCQYLYRWGTWLRAPVNCPGHPAGEKDWAWPSICLALELAHRPSLSCLPVSSKDSPLPMSHCLPYAAVGSACLCKEGSWMGCRWKRKSLTLEQLGSSSGFREFLSGFFPATSFSHAATTPVRLKGKCSFLL